MTTVIGLTGSIGMGKTTASNMLKGMGLPVCDSDSLVHQLLGKGGAAVSPVGKHFDNVVVDEAVDRAALGQKVFGNADALKQLENIIHPLVRAAQQRFIKTCRSQKRFAVVLDVPLLFEVETDKICDLTLVVSAPRFIQAQRVLSRPGMKEERFHATLKRQMSDREKRKRADFVVQTGLNKRETLNRLREIVKLLR
ncbi:MAG: dephospho-CoA kinase [Rhodospirillaceae bacterium]|nr:dephospho-CoA kinase [Rhodospirillaceae bacterium]|tara:strand:- start:13198 stop:13785 length:588 start_codon:yes stop_codon:yes gene_type:complete